MRSTEQWLRDGNLMLARPSYNQAWLALVGLGRFESAAVLRGRAGSEGELHAPSWYTSLAEKPEADLLEHLGTERFEKLRRSGAAMSQAEAIALLRSEARAVLGER